MNALKATALAAVAALALAAPPVPAAAGPHWRDGHGWGHRGFWGGPGLVLGVVGAALAAGVAADAYCVRYVPVYDNGGNVVGRRPVNAC